MQKHAAPEPGVRAATIVERVINEWLSKKNRMEKFYITAVDRRDQQNGRTALDAAKSPCFAG